MSAFARAFAITVTATLWLGLTSARQADAGPIVTLNFAGNDITGALSVAANEPNGHLYSFGGNNSYALFELSPSKGGSIKFLQFVQTGDIEGHLGKTGARLAIQVTITSNSPGTATDGAWLFNTTHDVRTNGGGFGNSSLVITTEDGGYMAPTGDVILSSDFSFDSDNDPGSGTFASQLIGSDGTILGEVAGTGSIETNIPSGPFQLRNVTTITKVNANTNYRTVGETMVQGDAALAAPEPSTFAMGGVTLGLLALWHGRRRLQAPRVES